MHVNIQEVYMQTAIAVYCEFISYVQGFGMHETVSMQALLTFCVYQGDLAFPECQNFWAPCASQSFSHTTAKVNPPTHVNK